MLAIFFKLVERLPSLGPTNFGRPLFIFSIDRAILKVNDRGDCRLYLDIIYACNIFCANSSVRIDFDTTVEAVLSELANEHPRFF